MRGIEISMNNNVYISMYLKELKTCKKNISNTYLKIMLIKNKLRPFTFKPFLNRS